nr:cell division protein FtsQ/DivIB [uncultured Sellimonas sp.]
MGDNIRDRERARKKIKRKRKKQLYKRVGIGIVIVVLIIGWSLAFQIQEIQVEGNRFLSKEEVRSYVKKQSTTQNSLILLLQTKNGNYPVLDTAESMSFQMVNPWTIKVKVKEKEPVFSFEDNGNYICLDREGTVLARTKKQEKGTIRIEGLNTKNIKKGKKIAVQNPAIFEEILEVSRTLESTKLDVDRILCDGENITLYFEEIQVNLGNGGQREKVNQLSAILPNLKGQKGILHLEHFGEGMQTIYFEKAEQK